MKDSLVIYKSWCKSLAKLDDSDYRAIMDAIIAYGMDDIEPELTGALDVVFTIMRDQIDFDRAKWEETCRKRSEAGKKGNAKRWANRNCDISDENNRNATKSIAKIADYDYEHDYEYEYKRKNKKKIASGIRGNYDWNALEKELIN